MAQRWVSLRNMGTLACLSLTQPSLPRARSQIISNSWDGGPQVNPPLQQAVERVGKSGVLFVVAAGNSGINLTKVGVDIEGACMLAVLPVAAGDAALGELPLSGNHHLIHLPAECHLPCCIRPEHAACPGGEWALEWDAFRPSAG